MHKLVHKLVQIVRSQTHFYSAFRYGDQQEVSPMLRCVVSRCSRQCLTILVHIPNHFIAPTVFSSLLMSSNSPPPPLSCVPSIFSTTPNWLRTSPSCVLQSSLTCPPFYASRTIEHPTQRVANPDSWPSYPGSDDNPNNESLEFLSLLS